MEIVQLILLGAIVGFMSSFFGIGGGSLIVPVLYSLYPKLPANIVVPISLGSIFIVTSINTFKFSKKKLLPPFKTILSFISLCIIGGLLGVQMLNFVDSNLVKKLMGIILIILSFKLLLSKKTTTKNSNGQTSGVSDLQIRALPFGLTGFIGSFISSITGLGGGVIFTPAFIHILKVPMRFVSPLSNIGMCTATLMGTVPHLFSDISTSYFELELLQNNFIGRVNLPIIVAISIGAYLTSNQGIKYNSKVSEQRKKILLAIVLLCFSVKLLV